LIYNIKLYTNNFYWKVICFNFCFFSLKKLSMVNKNFFIYKTPTKFFVNGRFKKKRLSSPWKIYFYVTRVCILTLFLFKETLILNPPKECFPQNKLRFDNGLVERDLWSVVPEKPTNTTEQITGIFRYKVQLPKDLTCEHCLFQWWWLGNLDNQLYISKIF
jgi:hypothetical protein